MRPYLLSESTWAQIRDQEYDLAVLPWGACEAHNLHLPYGTDSYETEGLIVQAAKLAWEKGARVIVLPSISYGVNTGQQDIKLTMNLMPSTQQYILKDVIENLRRDGIFKFLVFNGHGGNDFKQILRELGIQFPDMILATCNWFESVDKSVFFTNPGDHADEMETSLMLCLKPKMVAPLREAGQGKAKKFRVKAFNENWAWTERKWSGVTSDTGIGDPGLSTGQKGAAYFDEVTRKISGFIVDLASADLKDFYE